MYDQPVQALFPMMPAPSEKMEVQEGGVNGMGYRVYTPKGHKGGLPIGVK